VDKHLEEFRTIERLNRVSQLTTLAEGDHEIIPGLGATGGDTVWC
jgi:hypothetical protein